MTICRFCRNREASVDSHIIPQSFIAARSVDGEPNYILSSRQEYASKTWTGVYDREIVCLECEAKFSEFDRYGHRFFHVEKFSPMNDEDGNVCAYQLANGDAGKLKLFVLSILWRASVSGRPEVRQVDLGRWEPEICRMIENKEPGAADRFPVVLQKFEGAEDVAPMFYPYRTEMSGNECYKIELAGCAAITGLQGRGWPDALIELALTQGKPIVLFVKDYAGSNERKRFIDIARVLYSKRGRLPGKRK
jgi:hypothetical protein